MFDVKVEDSILLSTKKSLGIDPHMEHFDPDIIMCINSAFNILTQLGVGPSDGFSISSANDRWDQFTGEGPWWNMVKSYIFMKTRILFDPPTGNALLQCYQDQIREFECRLNYRVDPEDTFD